jgi:hypothetical protein
VGAVDINLEPISVQQFRLAVRQGTSTEVGLCLLKVANYGTGSESVPSFGTRTGSAIPKVFQATQNVITEFTFNNFPTLGGIYAVVFDSKPNPDLNTGLLFILGFGYDGTFNNTFVPFCADTGQKFNVTPSIMGPYKLPGDHRYFRVYRYITDYAIGTEGNLVCLATQPAPANDNFDRMFALINVYGY